jgi:hypothetical protein
VTLLLVASVLAIGAGRPDPPLLVHWSRIGDIWLGEARARVEREYHRFHVVQRYGNAVQGTYRLHGDDVVVTYYGGRVGALEFATPYYRTKTGFGVGSKIPLGPCHRTKAYPCEHRWRGFVWNRRLREDPCSCWTKVGLGKTSLSISGTSFGKPWFIIYIRHGRVSDFVFDLKYVD